MQPSSSLLYLRPDSELPDLDRELYSMNLHLIRKTFKTVLYCLIQKATEMTSKLDLRRSNPAEEKKQLLSRIDYEDYEHDNDCKILQTSALKIQNPDVSTLRVLSKKEEKKRIKSLHRLVRKDGDRRTTTQTGLRMKKRKFVDLFTTMMDYSWPVLLGLICALYFLDWLFFAGVWYLVAVVFNDLTEEGKIPGNK